MAHDDYTTTEAPEKSGKAEAGHRKLHYALSPGGRWTEGRYPVLELASGVRVTPALLARLLDVLEECEGWLDEECRDDDDPDTYELPTAVVDAMSKVYKELER